MNLQVTTTEDIDHTQSSQCLITIKHLLTHTSGLGYDFDGGEALQQLYKRARLWSGPGLSGFIDKVAKLPLKHQPGGAFTYAPYNEHNFFGKWAAAYYQALK